MQDDKSEVRALVAVATAVHASTTLGAVGPRQCIADQLLSKADEFRPHQ